MKEEGKRKMERRDETVECNTKELLEFILLSFLTISKML